MAKQMQLSAAEYNDAIVSATWDLEWQLVNTERDLDALKREKIAVEMKLHAEIASLNARVADLEGKLKQRDQRCSKMLAALKHNYRIRLAKVVNHYRSQRNNDKPLRE